MRFKEFFEATVPYYQSQDYRSAINRGHQSERETQGLVNSNCGWQLKLRGEHDDMHRKIDADIVINGRSYPTQMKLRRVGTDVRYEVARNFQFNDPNQKPPHEILLSRLNGRDMNGQSYYTLTVDNTGTNVTLVPTKVGVDMINQAVAQWKDFLIRFKNMPKMLAMLDRKFQASNGVQLLIQYDQRDRGWKVLAFINPSTFPNVQTCKLDRPLNTWY